MLNNEFVKYDYFCYKLIKKYGIFAEGMKRKWNGLNYIEMCSGPGRCIYREDAKEFDASISKTFAVFYNFYL